MQQKYRSKTAFLPVKVIFSLTKQGNKTRNALNLNHFE